MRKIPAGLCGGLVWKVPTGPFRSLSYAEPLRSLSYADRYAMPHFLLRTTPSEDVYASLGRHVNTPEAGNQASFKNFVCAGFEYRHIRVFMAGGRKITINDFFIPDKHGNQ